MSSTEQIVYRQAVIRDIETLVSLRSAFLAELSQADPNDLDLRRSLACYFSETIPSGEYVGFLAEANGQIVAMNGLVYHRYPPNGRNRTGVDGYVMNVYTLPEWRGRGIASQLLNDLIAVARAAKCSRLRLNAMPKAAPVYRRADFVSVTDLMQLDLT